MICPRDQLLRKNHVSRTTSPFTDRAYCWSWPPATSRGCHEHKCDTGRASWFSSPRTGRLTWLPVALRRTPYAWKSWNLDRRSAAIRAVLHRVIITPLPPGAASNVAGNSKDKILRREREMAILRQRVEFDWRI